MSTPAAVSLVRRATRAALAREHGHTDPWRWHDGVPADAFLDAVAQHRVASVLAPWVEVHDYSPPVAERIRALHAQARLEAMRLIRSTAIVSAQLDGFDHLFLKGPALAVQTTGDPTARGAGDIDLLVRPQDLGRAVETLTGCGWSVRPGYTLNQASWAWRHQLRTTYELGLVGPLGTVDLHWRLDPTHGGLPGFEELWERHVTVDLGSGSGSGRSCGTATLAPADAFRHALRHAAKDRWSQLRSLVDIHRLAADPAHWPARCDQVERATLSVVEATLGLPTSVPGSSRRFRSSAAAIPVALRTQLTESEEARFIGDKSLTYARYLLSSSRRPRDLVMTASMLALPSVLVAEVQAERTAPAVAAAAVRRLGHTLHTVAALGRRGRR